MIKGIFRFKEGSHRNQVTDNTSFFVAKMQRNNNSIKSIPLILKRFSLIFLGISLFSALVPTGDAIVFCLSARGLKSLVVLLVGVYG